MNYAIILLLWCQYATLRSQPSVREWLTAKATRPIAFVRLRGTDDGKYATESLKIEKTSRVARKATSPDDFKLKANLKFRHEQRHPNGSVSGSYGFISPAGNLNIMHYVKDGGKYRETLENGNSPLEAQSSNFVPNQRHGGSGGGGVTVLGGQLTYPIPGIGSTPILQSAVGTVDQYNERSPLFEKYYRPSADEVQRTYDYHRMRSGQDPSTFRPQEPSQFADLKPGTAPELQAVHGEFQQSPYQVQPQGDPRMYYYQNSYGYHHPQAAAAYHYPSQQQQHYQPAEYQDPYNRNPQTPTIPTLQTYPLEGNYAPSPSPLPQTLPQQQPVYIQTYDGNAFLPGSTYYGRPAPNTATFNQPYPPNIPIYSQPLPATMPTYAQPLPTRGIVYNQQIPAAPIPGTGSSPSLDYPQNAQNAYG